jgi:uncharacterized repeat protein (TIGR02543 family)
MTIYLDGEVIFSEQGTNLNDKDTTNDSFLKLGMYTQILDDRHYFVDAVEMATFLPSTVSDWVNGATTDVNSQTRLLTVLDLENGSVTGGGTFSLGDEATLTATPSAGYVFASWSGDVSSTDNPLTITVDDNKSIGATFTEDTRDPDEDGLSNYQELVVLGTDPNDADSDGDGWIDSDEVNLSYEPTEAGSVPVFKANLTTHKNPDGSVKDLTISFVTRTGGIYYVEESSDLVNWNVREGEIAGSGVIESRSVPMSAQQIFLRVKELVP